MARFMMEKAKTHRRAAGDGAAQPVRAPPRAPHRRRGSADVVGEHRRCVPEDGDHFGPAVDRRSVISSRTGSRIDGRADLQRWHRGRRASCSPPTTPSSRLRRRPAAAGSASFASAGPTRCDVAQRLTGRATPLEPRHATLAQTSRAGAARSIRSSLTFFPAPHSYTGEDVVEISAHGSPVLLRAIVECGDGRRRAARRAGRVHVARVPATAGSISCRPRRCAISIDAVTPLQARAAFDQLEGTLTARIREIDARCSISRRGSRRRSISRTRAITSSTQDAAAREIATIGDAIDALLATPRAGG